MVRTRIAPSPTGPLHLGNARTALFSWLYARQNGGVFVVRVEDTDVERSESKWERDALENFAWLGLDWEEGVTLDGQVGSHGPYRQSERSATYEKHLTDLINRGYVYHCFCTKEELETMRQEQMARGEAPRYIGICRDLTAAEISERQSRGAPSILRFKSEQKSLTFNDLIRGAVTFEADLLGDMIIAKDIAHPLYNFAVVVDDYTMEISHVFRGEEHISNTPKQMLIQEALGFPSPQYGHLPIILGTDRSKLSKRHGDASMTEFRAAGYLPEAMMNFLALLGWHPSSNKEVFAASELVQEFSLERVQKSGAIFNIEKLQWLNGEYIRTFDSDTLYERYTAFSGVALHDKERMKGALETVRERVKTLGEVDELIRFYFEMPQYECELLRWKKMSDNELKEIMSKLKALLEPVSEADFTKEKLEAFLMPQAVEIGEGDRGRALWPLRAALSGRETSPGPFEIAAVLGKEEALKRIDHALELLKT